MGGRRAPLRRVRTAGLGLTGRQKGTIVTREKHNGSFDIIHVKDAAGHVFATRHKNVSSSPPSFTCAAGERLEAED